MSSVRTTWDGIEWQKYMNLLLSLRYGPGGYQPVADRVNGDFGIEGYSRDGTIFQAYAAEEPLTTSQLYEKQRGKITRDLSKLEKNALQLSKVFAGNEMKSWVLLVPRFEDKEIIVHCGKKTEEMRNKNLPFLAADFRVLIQDDSSFQVEKDQLSASTLSGLKIEMEEPTDEELQAWHDENDEFSKNLVSKIAKITADPVNRDKLIARVIRNYLQGQNTIRFLLEDYPEIGETILTCKRSKESSLEIESLINDLMPRAHFLQTMKDYRELLVNDVSSLPRSLVDNISNEAIADWLLRCPLDFS